MLQDKSGRVSIVSELQYLTAAIGDEADCFSTSCRKVLVAANASVKPDNPPIVKAGRFGLLTLPEPRLL